MMKDPKERKRNGNKKKIMGEWLKGWGRKGEMKMEL